MLDGARLGPKLLSRLAGVLVVEAVFPVKIHFLDKFGKLGILGST